ncbi:MAG: hypothetical protein E6J90_16490 [Deltaproteobacteria bacterium]|nr:MAG: hypothetical protein E6J91_16705 [Deltaproteobacteria bacterium]TMQ20313.1 MAG: hypothetical protein E6J90_16490 [Deltaproteobacteria bacterium]
MKKSGAQLNYDISVYLGEPDEAPRRARTSPCRSWPGAGYLVQASYRVPPFLADDVLWVQRRDSGPRGRVYCTAFDMLWYERIPERSGWLDLETLTPIWQPGTRVELSPTCSLWQQGYQRGTVRQVTKDWTVIVKLDAPEVRQLQRFTDHTLLKRV